MSSSSHHRHLQGYCCQPKTMCGHGLGEAVIIIGWTSVAVSTLALVSCITYLYVHKNRESRDPVWGITTISAMTIVCLSAYQIIISVLMLWQRMQKKPKFFFYSMWYVSHLSLLTLYCIIFSAIVVVHITHGHYVWGIGYFIFCTAYVAILIYFEIIINSYLSTPEMEERFI